MTSGRFLWGLYSASNHDALMYFTQTSVYQVECAAYYYNAHTIMLFLILFQVSGGCCDNDDEAREICAELAKALKGAADSLECCYSRAMKRVHKHIRCYSSCLNLILKEFMSACVGIPVCDLHLVGSGVMVICISFGNWFLAHP